MRKLSLVLVALAGLGLTAGSASAFPSGGIGAVTAPAPEAAASVENVRYVCGPYRCWWRPNYYGYGYGYGYRPYWRPYYRPYGFYRPYRRFYY